MITRSATNVGEFKEFGPLLQNPVGTLVSPVLLSRTEDGTAGQGCQQGRQTAWHKEHGVEPSGGEQKGVAERLAT